MTARAYAGGVRRLPSAAVMGGEASSSLLPTLSPSSSLEHDTPEASLLEDTAADRGPPALHPQIRGRGRCACVSVARFTDETVCVAGHRQRSCIESDALTDRLTDLIVASLMTLAVCALQIPVLLCFGPAC